jgi:hypothetical protein
MEDITILKPKLSRLSSRGLLETLADLMQQAMSEKWPRFLDVLVNDEVKRHDHKQLARRLSESGLYPNKTFMRLNLSFKPSIHEPTLRELATCPFADRKENIFFTGPSGVGKRHLDQALGHEAARRGPEVLFRRIGSLLQWIGTCRGNGSFECRLKLLASLPPRIVPRPKGKRDLIDGEFRARHVCLRALDELSRYKKCGTEYHSIIDPVPGSPEGSLVTRGILLLSHRVAIGKRGR